MVIILGQGIPPILTIFVVHLIDIAAVGTILTSVVKTSCLAEIQTHDQPNNERMHYVLRALVIDKVGHTERLVTKKLRYKNY